MSTTVGTVELIAKIDTNNYTKGVETINKANDSVEKSTSNTEIKSNKSWAKMGIAIGAVAAVAQTVLTKAMSAVSDSVGSAIKRVDTLNNSTRTFANMGFSADESNKAIATLTKSIEGLPTPLDSAVRGMTSLAATYGSVEQGQKMFTALNNAILGFGGTAAEVDNAIQQISQLPMDGPLDAQTWNSLRNSGLTPVLVAMAKDMGLSVNEMKKKFGEGELTVADFNKSLQKLDTEGGGGLKSLQKIAKDSTKGIGTGFANMQTAITRGLASIIQAIGTENISNAISAIGKGFEFVLKAVANVVGFVSSAGAAFTSWVKQNEVLVRNLAIVFGALLIPQVIVFGVQSAIALAKFTAAMIIAGVQSLIAGAKMAAAWLLALGPIGLIIAAVAGAVALIIANWDTVKNFTVGVFSAIGNAGLAAWNFIKRVFGGVAGWFTGVFQGAWNGITNIWNRVSGFFSGVWNNIKNAFNGVTSLGSDIVKGLWNGINDMAGWIGGKIKGFGEGVLKGIKDFFGIKSPSRVMRDEVGKMIGAGMAGGITDSVKLATDAAKGMSRDVLGTYGLSDGGFNAVGTINASVLDNQAAGSSSEYNIGTINIASEVDGERWLQRLTGDSEITSHGLVPTQSYMGAR